MFIRPRSSFFPILVEFLATAQVPSPDKPQPPLVALGLVTLGMERLRAFGLVGKRWDFCSFAYFLAQKKITQHHCKADGMKLGGPVLWIASSTCFSTKRPIPEAGWFWAQGFWV